MNAEDNGRRRAVVATNNEASATDARRMRRNGLRPGEIDWEAERVCEAVTEPRLKNVVSSDATPASNPRRGGGTPVWGGFALFDQSFQSKSVSFSDRLHSLSMTGFL